MMTILLSSGDIGSPLPVNLLEHMNAKKGSGKSRLSPLTGIQAIKYVIASCRGALEGTMQFVVVVSKIAASSWEGQRPKANVAAPLGSLFSYQRRSSSAFLFLGPQCIRPSISANRRGLARPCGSLQLLHEVQQNGLIGDSEGS
jgi:hypothetical protein